MAYYDENGNITIDEKAAEADIANITKAITSIEEAQRGIQQIYIQCGAFSGEGAEAMIAAGKETDDQLARLVEELNREIKMIRTTVAKYQEIDRNLRDMINAR